MKQATFHTTADCTGPDCEVCKERKRVVNFVLLIEGKISQVMVSWEKLPYLRVETSGLSCLVEQGDYGQPEVAS